MVEIGETPNISKLVFFYYLEILWLLKNSKVGFGSYKANNDGWAHFVGWTLNNTKTWPMHPTSWSIRL